MPWTDGGAHLPVMNLRARHPAAVQSPVFPSPPLQAHTGLELAQVLAPWTIATCSVCPLCVLSSAASPSRAHLQTHQLLDQLLFRDSCSSEPSTQPEFASGKLL